MNTKPKTHNGSRCSGTTIAVNLEKATLTWLGDHKILLGEFIDGTVDGGHDEVRGSVINGELLAGQHGGPQTQRNNN